MGCCMEDLGARLKRVRGMFDLTQSQLAEKTGSSAAALGQYEKGEKIPGGKALAGLAQSGVNINWLLTGQGSPKEISLEEKLQILTGVISSVDSFLNNAKKHNLLILDSEKKNKWIVALYEDFLKKSGDGAPVENIEEEVHYKMGRVLI